MDPVVWGLVGGLADAILSVFGMLGVPVIVHRLQGIRLHRAHRDGIVDNLRALRMASDDAVTALEVCINELFRTGRYDTAIPSIANAAHLPVDDLGLSAISGLARQLQIKIDDLVRAIHQAQQTYTLLVGTPGGDRQLAGTRAALESQLDDLRSRRRQLRDEIVRTSQSLGKGLPKGSDAATS